MKAPRSDIRLLNFSAGKRPMCIRPGANRSESVHTSATRLEFSPLHRCHHRVDRDFLEVFMLMTLHKLLLSNICCVATLTSLATPKYPPTPGSAPNSTGMPLAAVPIRLQVLLNSIRQVWVGLCAKSHIFTFAYSSFPSVYPAVVSVSI